MFSLDAPDASSHTRQVLTPLSQPSPGAFGHDGAGSGDKKRKRDGSTMDDLLKDPFAVKAYPPKGSVKPRSLQPLILIRRSILPLSSLDINASNNALPPSRLFEGHVKILELEERMGTQPMVLIARLDDGLTLYAVEREDRGLYVLCRLGSWVNLQQLRASAVASKQDLSNKTLEEAVGNGDVGAVPIITPEGSKYSKKKRLAIEAIQHMVKRPSTVEATVGPETPLEQPVPEAPVEEVPSQVSAAEMFDNIRAQYLEALYLSKASLAYFAKGPLPRARAAFHLDYDSTLDMNEYIIFLESLVLSTTLIDKKFRDGVPGCVSLIDIHDHSADNANQATVKPKKRKSSKKVKPGKTGLYPQEDGLIRKWWASYDDEADAGGPGTSREEIAKSRIAQLRIRETQLQMIVILEVLALQPLATATEDIGDGLPSTLSISVGRKEKSFKPKKPDHLTMLIDVHIDRLCIWQSIAIEAVTTPIDGIPNLNESQSSSNLSKHADNILRDFCVEIIIPFYSARLPERCAIMNRKLGGPVIVSPPKQRQLAKSASCSGVQSRPGAATKRPVPAKPRQSLQRVLSNERERRSGSHGPGKAPSLMRSITAPTVKRETSEASSLTSIPTAEGQSLTTSRGGFLNSRRFSQREVDLSNLVPATKSKTTKKSNVEAELQEAISALKKPNRELAGNIMAETAEKRAASASHSKKSKKPVRNPLFQAVQISATPKTTRQKDALSKQQRQTLRNMDDEIDAAVIPPSSLPRIPQSVIRSSGERLNRNPLVSSIQATPTRKSDPAGSNNGFLSAYVTDQGGYLPSSPLQNRRSSAQLLVPDSAMKMPPTLFPSYGVEETPLKKRQEPPPKARSHPNTTGLGSDKENVKVTGRVDVEARGKQGVSQDSVYQSLGWDDDDDDELA